MSQCLKTGKTEKIQSPVYSVKIKVCISNMKEVSLNLCLMGVWIEE